MNTTVQEVASSRRKMVSAPRSSSSSASAAPRVSLRRWTANFAGDDSAAVRFADQAAQMMLASSPEQFRAGQAAGAPGLARDPATQAAMVDWAVASDRQALATAIREVMTTDTRPQLAAMTTPVWAVYAADDEGGAPAALAEAMWTREYAGLPGVRLVRVDGSRHFIMADQPARFAEIVDQFLAE